MSDPLLALDLDLAVATWARAHEDDALDEVLRDEGSGFFAGVLHLLNR